MALDLIDETFTPAEAAKITGVSAERQRQWRVLGLTKGLESTPDKGWTRWGGQDLALLMLLGRLQKRMSISQAMKAQGPHGRPLRRMSISQAMKALVAKGHTGALYVYFHGLLATGGDIVKFLNREGDIAGLVPRYLVAEGDEAFAPYETLFDLPALRDVGVLIDARELGRLMAERAPRPLARLVDE